MGLPGREGCEGVHNNGEPKANVVMHNMMSLRDFVIETTEVYNRQFSP
jgi:hypothetical protein